MHSPKALRFSVQLGILSYKTLAAMDAYNTELKAMVDVIDGKADRSVIRSSYEDAFETYKLVSFTPVVPFRRWAAQGSKDMGDPTRGGKGVQGASGRAGCVQLIRD